MRKILGHLCHVSKPTKFELSLQKINSSEGKSGFQIFDSPKFYIFLIGLKKIFIGNAEIFPTSVVDTIYFFNFFLIFIFLIAKLAPQYSGPWVFGLCMKST